MHFSAFDELHLYRMKHSCFSFFHYIRFLICGFVDVKIDNLWTQTGYWLLVFNNLKHWMWFKSWYVKLHMKKKLLHVTDFVP